MHWMIKGLAVIPLAVAALATWSQPDAVYRCPDPNSGRDLYTGMASAEDAKARGCKSIDDGVILSPPKSRAEQIRDARYCVEYYRSQVAYQQRIAKESGGHVNAAVMYESGRAIVACRDELDRLERQAAAAKKK